MKKYTVTLVAGITTSVHNVIDTILSNTTTEIVCEFGETSINGEVEDEVTPEQLVQSAIDRAALMPEVFFFHIICVFMEEELFQNRTIVPHFKSCVSKLRSGNRYYKFDEQVRVAVEEAFIVTSKDGKVESIEPKIEISPLTIQADGSIT